MDFDHNLPDGGVNFEAGYHVAMSDYKKAIRAILAAPESVPAQLSIEIMKVEARIAEANMWLEMVPYNTLKQGNFQCSRLTDLERQLAELKKGPNA